MSTPAASGRGTAAVPPALGGSGLELRGRSRAVASAMFALAGVGVVLAVLIPALDLRSSGCGPLDCGLLQTIGKVMTGLGVGIGLTIVAVGALRAGKLTMAICVVLIAGPSFVWAALIADQWRDLISGTGEVSQMLASAREYAAAQEHVDGSGLSPLLTNGRGDWSVVRIVHPDGAKSYVLSRRSGGRWTPVAIAAWFDRDALRALGAPTDLMKDAA